MNAARSLLILIRVVGVLALVLMLYVWVYPASVKKWIGSEPVAVAPASTVAVAAPAADMPAPAADKPAPAAENPDPAAGSPAPELPPALKPSKSQEAVALWLGTKYHVVPEAIETLVVEADKLTKQYHLSPNLIIAVMAIESNFHPYIQSEAGAQGLMQVMPGIHAKRLAQFKEKSSFADPIVSLKVGADILRDCVKLRGGSESEGLRYYFGGGPMSGTYIEKVKAEQRRLNLVAAGTHVPVD
ncbi:MAG: lytic transglycosylase domain-containing protein [Massilia sp.]